MRIAAGFELAFECERPTPMVLMLSPHPSRSPDLLSDVALSFTPRVIARNFTDAFGNHATRIVAPVGTTTISTGFAMHDSVDPTRSPRRRSSIRSRRCRTRRSSSCRGAATARPTA